MKLLAIDIETTGLNPMTHGITEFAAVYFDLEKKEPEKRFYRWVQPEGMLWSQYCLNLHHNWIKKVNERIKKGDWLGDGLDNPPIVRDYTVLNIDFRNWAFNVGMYHEEMLSKRIQKPTPAGKCFGTFDANFLNFRFGSEQFRKRVIDPMHYYMDFEKDGDIPPDLETCKARAIECGATCFDNQAVKHNALDDALDIMNLLQFAYVREWMTGYHNEHRYGSIRRP